VQAGESLHDPWKAGGQIIPRPAIEPHTFVDLQAMTLKPSCLISCSLERIRQAFAVIHPRWERMRESRTYRIWAGGAR
jgi:hypothetical protein